MKLYIKISAKNAVLNGSNVTHAVVTFNPVYLNNEQRKIIAEFIGLECESNPTTVNKLFFDQSGLESYVNDIINQKTIIQHEAT